MEKSSIALYGLTIILAIILITSFIPFNTEAPAEEKSDHFEPKITAFDKEYKKTHTLTPLGSMHEHATFHVYDNDEPIDFSAPRYHVKSMYIHVESENDQNQTGKIIHIHAQQIPLNMFFESLEMEMSQYMLYVNDKQTEYETYLPRDGDRILLTTATGEQLKKELVSLEQLTT